MTKQDRTFALLAGIIAVTWWATYASAQEPVWQAFTNGGPLYIPPVDNSSVGPVEPVTNTPYVGPTVEETDAVSRLCHCAPNPFGPACKGISWIEVANPLWLGVPTRVDLRDPKKCTG